MARRASHAKLALRKVPPEVCAERMTRLLSSKPKSQKTRDYLATLPKRKKPIRVEPHEFVTERVREQKEAAATARRVLVQIEEAARPKSTFRARLRPGARKASPMQSTPASRWACRPSGVRFSDVAIPKREPRTLDQVIAQRAALSAVQDDICGLCGAKMGGENVRRSIDHVIPRSLGGADRLGNLLLSHGECNGVKSNDIPTGCELVMLLAINAKLGVQPLYWKAPAQGTSAYSQDAQRLEAKPAGPVRRMRQFFTRLFFPPNSEQTEQ